MDGATGAKKWEFLTGSPVSSSPAIGADGTVYFGSYDNKVYALAAATGAKKWEFAAGFFVWSSPAIGPDGTVYVGSAHGRLYALFGTAPLADSAWPMFGRDLRHTHRSCGSPLKITTVTVQEGQVVIEWTGNAVLQSAKSVTGPWEDMAWAASPHALAPEPKQAFCRLRSRQ